MNLPKAGETLELVPGRDDPNGISVSVDHKGVVTAKAPNGAVATLRNAPDRRVREYALPGRRMLAKTEHEALDAALDRGQAILVRGNGLGDST